MSVKLARSVRWKPAIAAKPWPLQTLNTQGLGYIGTLEKKMETTISNLRFWV